MAAGGKADDLGAERGLEVLEEVALGAEELDVGAVLDDLLLGPEGLVLGPVNRGEAPLQEERQDGSQRPERMRAGSKATTARWDVPSWRR